MTQPNRKQKVENAEATLKGWEREVIYWTSEHNQKKLTSATNSRDYWRVELETRKAHLLEEEAEIHQLKNDLTIVTLRSGIAVDLLKSALASIKGYDDHEEVEHSYQERHYPQDYIDTDRWSANPLIVQIEHFLNPSKEKPNGRTTEREGAKSQNS